jgi:hypothetical protein
MQESFYNSFFSYKESHFFFHLQFTKLKVLYVLTRTRGDLSSFWHIFFVDFVFMEDLMNRKKR